MARPRIFTAEERLERKRAQQRRWVNNKRRRRARDRERRREERALMQAEMARYRVREILSAPTGLYAGQFPIFTFALQDTLRFVRSL
jgi:hypothetical protein